MSVLLPFINKTPSRRFRRLPDVKISYPGFADRSGEPGRFS
jgi:hypothetical protein